MTTTEQQADGEGKDHVFSITVNGRLKTVTTQELTFDELVELAFPGGPRGENWVYTVGYRRGEGNKSGSLGPGDSVKVKDGMVFDVTQTDKS
jgi:hypothetical protein